MSTKPLVILIHGMGSHKPGAMTSTFVLAVNETLQKFPGWEEKSVEDELKIVEINYSNFFDEMREKMAERAKPVEERLASISALQGRVLHSLAATLTRFEGKFDSNHMFYTHWLDVIFYTTLLGAKLRADVALKLAQHISDHTSDTQIHVVAHSLGTAVIHDTLAQLMRGDFVANDQIGDLDPETHKLNTLWTVANVSRILFAATGISDPYHSIVKPGDEGCTGRMFNVRHMADPFTRPWQFDPQNDGAWINREDYEEAYGLIEIDAVTQYNTHDFGGYFRNPKVALPFLMHTLRFAPDDVLRKTMMDTFKSRTLQGQSAELKRAFSNIEISDRGTLERFFEVASDFYDLINTLEGSGSGGTHS